MAWLVRFSEDLLRTVALLAYGWLLPFVRLIRSLCRRWRAAARRRADGRSKVRCVVVPATIYKRPDPLIYCQSYLLAQGLAVTWDNPDIALYHNGLPVSSSNLFVNTVYEIRATVWNGSTEGFAVDMPVDFSFLTFGIGTTSTAIGRKKVNLPVKGAAGHPATAIMEWRTPPVPGHYCLQVNLVWADDSNLLNNLGQKNTNVGVAHSPAVFEFPVENPTKRPVTMTLIADSYVPPAAIECSEVHAIRGPADGEGPSDGDVPPERPTHEQPDRLCAQLAARHRKDAFPIPDGWAVEINPPVFPLAPGESRSVTVRITPPDSFAGTRAFNVNGIDDRGALAGGVTLFVQR